MGDFTTLDDLMIEHETVTVGSKRLKVTGLGLPHIIHIVRHHRDVLEELYGKATSGQLEADVETIMIDLAEKAGPLAGMIIACGMDSPENGAKAAKLPFSVQVDALEKILRLTLVAEGGLGKLVETVSGVVEQVAILTTPKP